jgi:hypothetical protein
MSYRRGILFYASCKDSCPIQITAAGIFNLLHSILTVKWNLSLLNFSAEDCEETKRFQFCSILLIYMLTYELIGQLKGQQGHRNRNGTQK